jgi:hypothetical protein
MILDAEGFDGFVEGLCGRFYAARFGRPSLTPGIYFRSLLIGYFEGIGAERGIAWQLAHVSGFNLSLVIRQLLGAGTPRELKNKATALALRIIQLIIRRKRSRSGIEPQTASTHNPADNNRLIRSQGRTPWNSATCTTGCHGGAKTPSNQVLEPHTYPWIEAVPSHCSDCCGGKWPLKPQADRAC